MVEGSGFENRRRATYQGFESLRLRHPFRAPASKGFGGNAACLRHLPFGGESVRWTRLLRVGGLLLLALACGPTRQPEPPSSPQALPASAQPPRPSVSEHATEPTVPASESTQTPECPKQARLCPEARFAQAVNANGPRSGSWIDLTGERAYLSLPATREPPLPGILLLHNAMGLAPSVEFWADRLAELGYAVLALDFYEGQLATTPEQAIALRTQANSRAPHQVDLARSGYAMLADDPRVRSRRRALVGWSYGGAWATYLATELADVNAVVTYAGSAIGDGASASHLEAPVLMIRGASDNVFSASEATEFVRRLEAANKRVELLEVPGGHAFADPRRDDYSASGNWQAFLRMRAFLSETLGR